jgi:competence protein ComGC
MNRFILSILFLLSIPSLSFAQDTIIKRGGAVRLCRVDKETKEKVFFSFEQDKEEVSRFLKKADIEAIKYATYQGLDTIVKNDGVVRICTIQREDSANIYVSIKLEGKKTDAFVKKSNIQTIKYGKLIPRKPNQYFTHTEPETITQ